METRQNITSYENALNSLTSSMEDYLKAVFILSYREKVVRVKEIARMLDCKMPSVTVAMNRLKKAGLIDSEKYGYIELTENGRKIGSQIYSRFDCLSDFLNIVLKVDASDIADAACKIEHCITPEVYQKINSLVVFYKKEQSQNSEWIKRQECFIKNKSNIADKLQ